MHTIAQKINAQINKCTRLHKKCRSTPLENLRMDQSYHVIGTMQNWVKPTYCKITSPNCIWTMSKPNSLRLLSAIYCKLDLPCASLSKFPTCKPIDWSDQCTDLTVSTCCCGREALRPRMHPALATSPWSPPASRTKPAWDSSCRTKQTGNETIVSLSG